MSLMRLVGKLSLDGAQFEKTLVKSKSSARRFSKDMNKMSSGITRKVMGIGAAYFGASAIKSRVKDVLDYATEIKNFADEMGMSTKAIQKWEFIASQVNLTMGDMREGFRGVIRNLEAFRRGTSSDINTTMSELKVTLEDIKDLSRDEIFELLSRKIRAAGDRGQVLTQKLASTSKSYRFLGADFTAMASAATDAGIIMKDSIVQQLAAMGDSMDVLNRKVRVLFSMIASPEFQEIVAGFKHLGAAYMRNIEPLRRSAVEGISNVGARHRYSLPGTENLTQEEQLRVLKDMRDMQRQDREGY